MNPLSGEESTQHVAVTRASGYVDTPIPKKCSTCKYFFNGGLCTNKIVMRDSQVPFADRSKFKKVDAENGCCNYWHPENR